MASEHLPASASEAEQTAAQEITRLAALMARLRDPQGGCPWDLEQTPLTIAPYAIEEAYEVLDAVKRQDWPAFADELGDLLLQVVYQSRLAEEAGLFSLATVARSVTEKMIRRHPHVSFSRDVLGKEAFEETDTKRRADTDLPAQWESLKELERQKQGVSSGALAGVPPALPALLRASKIAGRAARVGFDWPDVAGVVAKVHEEMDEFSVEMAAGDKDRMQDELGDVLFSLASLARRLKLDPEACLRQACDKFTRRFEAVEARLSARGLSMQDRPVEELDEHWQAVKKEQG
ncbi:MULTISPECIES: nucleoside triphosphate pyrophosphohydrolase [Acetobacter]|uniref:nucleoside triphosphate pyrophosphohydrolase n=1 Tax=Acetobacter TaxID=434 RepID=UPI001E337B17|nr:MULTISPECIES: nucleoside triphosphate pyrophosphohydrolase [Acetobacter]